MTNKKTQTPPHLQKLFDKKDAELKAMGIDQDPSDFLVECFRKAEKAGDDNALIHALAF